MRSFFFDPDGGLLLFLGRIVDLFWLSVLMIIGCIPIITIGASVSAGLYCCRKMILHEDAHLTRLFWKAYRENMKKGIILGVIVLDAFLVLGGLLILVLFDEKVLGFSLNIPIAVDVILLLLIFVCLLALMHLFPLNAYFENTVTNTIKNSFLLSISDLPVSICLLIINAAPFVLCCLYPVLLILEVFFGVGFCAFCSAQLYRKIMKKLGVDENAALNSAVDEEKESEDISQEI